MIFLVITGILFLILGGCYLANSWMRYHEWKGGTIIVVLSIIAIVFGSIGMVREHRNGADNQSARNAQTSNQNQNDTRQNVTQQQQKEDYALRQLQKTYAKFGDVSFDANTKTFTITPTSNDAKQAMNDIVQNPGNASQDGWGNVSKSVKSGSKQLVKLLGHGYRMRIVQPNNHHKSMILVKDGHTIYDIAPNTSANNDSNNQ